jgi:hypothetical protein
MLVDLDEPVSVGAVFSRGLMRPVWFSRGKRQVRINEVAFTWKTREGDTCIHHFSVTDGSGVYQLKFNTASFVWRIVNADG